MKNPNVDKEAMIRDAWVANRNDADYPEGTIILEVIDNNATEENLYGTIHQLYIFPDKLGKLN